MKFGAPSLTTEPSVAAGSARPRPADAKVASSAAAAQASVTTGVAGKPDLPQGIKFGGGPPGEAQLAELAAIRQLLYWLYCGAPALRPQLRSGLGEAMLQMGQAPLPPPGPPAAGPR